ncbi:MAG: phosphoribosylglycinamide formyltransferase [Gammaproteobacteria bacterium]|nr:phosphoribosylglycinamide formyltransferase [Gammaproteobacteria bacterium]MCW5584080.1 phosphoribosylglycinamide formyltransferase [Gammaproteobacteria bacterium]
MIRLGILGSTRGTNLNAIVTAIQCQRLSATLEIVISNKSSAPILERASMFGLHAEFVDPTGLTREEHDLKVSNLLKHHSVDLVVLMGYMRILSGSFIAAWKDKVINVHPSLLPAYQGMMDLDVHRAVIAAKERETGCTVHYVTERVDSGPMILQKKCQVYAADTVEELKARVQQLEGEVLVEAIEKIIQQAMVNR